MFKIIRQFFTHFLGKFCDDFLIGMNNHLPHQHIRQIFYIDRIPMFFIHVVAWHNLGILCPKFQRKNRITFQIDPQRDVIQLDKSKNLPTDSKNQKILAKRHIFCSFW